MKTCTCPVGTAIQEISTDACPYDFGQIQKIIFQRKFSTGTTRNVFADLATIQTAANWTTLMAATDGTKTQISPFVAAPTVAPGAKKEYGSDNEVPNGIPRLVGRENTPATMEILSLSPTIAAELKALECENLQVYLVNENGQIGCLKNSDDEYHGIDIEQLYISDRQLGGFNEPDKVMMEWYFKPNWSDNLQFVTPSDFNPLTDLAN